jgi:hypothetical protein
MRLRSVFAVAALALAGCASRRVETKDTSRTAPVDSFALGRATVDVYFFDPALFIGRTSPEVLQTEVPEKVKADLWLEYLHHSPIYLFSARDGSGDEVKQFCVRGDPQVHGTSAFYKVVVIPGKTPRACDPTLPENAGVAEKTQTVRGARGTLFEHMGVFQRPEMKRFVGNGVEMFGKYDRVTPYAEVKGAMVDLIRAELE